MCMCVCMYVYVWYFTIKPICFKAMKYDKLQMSIPPAPFDDKHRMLYKFYIKFNFTVL